MQEHPVPQNITSFEFKLIGDMTLRQFGYVGTGIALALLFFFAKPLSPWIRFPFVFLCPALGFALAFMPVEGRSLDRWLVSFIHAVFGNTLYVWKKEGVAIEALHGLQLPITAQAAGAQQAASRNTPAMKGALQQKPKNTLDQEELRILHGVQTDFTNQQEPIPSHPSRPIAQTSPRPTPAKPHVPVAKTYAGPVAPAYVLHAQPNLAMPQRQQPTAMRQPHQKPLTPKKIPLPAYQAATLQHASNAPSLGISANVLPAIQHMMQPAHPQAPIPAPIMHNPLAHAAQPVLQPAQAQMYQQAARELALLKQQNEFLFKKLKGLELALQNTVAKSAAQQTSSQSVTQEKETLNTHIHALETMLKDVVAHVSSLHTQEQQYKDLLAQIQGQLMGVSQEKIHAEEELQKLEQNAQNASEALKASEAQRESLEQKLKELESKLKETQLASITIQSEKAIIQPQVDNKPEVATEPKQEEQKVPLPPRLYAGTTPPAPPLPEGLSLVVQAKEATVTPMPAQSTIADKAGTPPVVIPEKPKQIVLPPEPVKKSSRPPAKPAKTVEELIPKHIDDAIRSLPTITSTPNAISGYIFDEQAKPIMDVIIVVKKSHGPTMRALKTNRVGQFSIVSPLPEGDYEVSFEKDGFIFTDMGIQAKGEVIPPIKVLGKKTN